MRFALQRRHPAATASLNWNEILFIERIPHTPPYPFYSQPVPPPTNVCCNCKHHNWKFRIIKWFPFLHFACACCVFVFTFGCKTILQIVIDNLCLLFSYVVFYPLSPLTPSPVECVQTNENRCEQTKRNNIETFLLNHLLALLGALCGCGCVCVALMHSRKSCESARIECSFMMCWIVQICYIL